MEWLSLDYTLPEIFRQSERTSLYQKHFKTLLDSGAAYEAEDSQNEPGKKVVRFKNPGSRIVFNDLIRGDVSFDTKELGDFVIGRSIDEPLYHLAVVVDDYEMGVTHVIRGEDHISNTPRQILILEALGFPRPLYAHIPLILAPDRSKLSKRHGAVSVTEYKERGYLPQAFVNYLTLLGWNPGGEQELYSLEELAERFSLDHVQKSGAIFDERKLKWFNREYMLTMDSNEFWTIALRYVSTKTGDAFQTPERNSIVSILRDRIQTFEELKLLDDAGEFSLFYENPVYESPALLWKKDPDISKTAERLKRARVLLSAIASPQWSTQTVKEVLSAYAEIEGRGEVLWPVRMALSGRDKSPDPFTIAGIIGKDVTIRRLDTALTLLSTT
jgi:glutamyl-tRNA synthetase